MRPLRISTVFHADIYKFFVLFACTDNYIINNTCVVFVKQQPRPGNYISQVLQGDGMSTFSRLLWLSSEREYSLELPRLDVCAVRRSFCARRVYALTAEIQL